MEDTFTFADSEARFKFAPSSAADTSTEFYSASVQAGRRKQMRTSQIAGIAIATVAIVLLIIPYTNSMGKMLFGFALLIAFVPTFIQMTQVYKAAKKNKKDPAVLPAMSFFDGGILVERENGQTNEYDYSHIAKIKETETLFMLVNSERSAYCVEKANLIVGSTDDFKAFISEKTGKSIEKEKYVLYDRRAWIRFVTAIVLVYALGMGANFVSDTMQNAPKVFTENEYSITLTKKFERKEQTNQIISYSDGESVDVNYRKFTHNEFPGSVDDWYNLYKEAAEDVELTELSLVKKDIDALQYDYITTDGNGATIYVYDTVESVNDSLYLTRFMCLKRNMDKYKPYFEKWSDSIIINNNADDEI